LHPRRQGAESHLPAPGPRPAWPTSAPAPWRLVSSSDEQSPAAGIHLFDVTSVQVLELPAVGRPAPLDHSPLTFTGAARPRGIATTF